MKTLCMWLGFAAAFIAFQFVGGDLFMAPGGVYTLERAVAAAVVACGGGFIGRVIGGLLEGPGEDSA